MSKPRLSTFPNSKVETKGIGIETNLKLYDFLDPILQEFISGFGYSLKHRKFGFIPLHNRNIVQQYNRNSKLAEGFNFFV